jgi:hypothetical protein
MPGKRGSGPFLFAHLLYALKICYALKKMLDYVLEKKKQNTRKDSFIPPLSAIFSP